jgi:hypothetical protein
MNGSPVAGLVRGWVRVYTRGLPAELRDARRDEVDGDLWCELEEAAALGRPGRSRRSDMLLRLLFGVPADISWRLAYHGNAPSGLERRSSTRTRILGLLAIVAVSSLAAQLILSSLIGEDAFWTWGGALVLMFGWMISFPAAALGVAWLVQDRVGPIGRFGAIVAMLGLFTMFAGFVSPIFVGSAMLMWDLARIGVISRLVPIVHVAIAIVSVATASKFIVDLPSLFGAPLLILYLLTWIAIGVSMIRGVPLGQARSG